MKITTIHTEASRSHADLAKPIGGGFLNRTIAVYRNFTYIGKNGTIVSRTLDKLTRFIGNYHHYRGKGFNIKSSWNLAGMTLP